MISTADIAKIHKVLDSMRQYEVTLSDFYTRCADAWQDDRIFWQALAAAESRHAENIEKIREILTAKPENFDMGRPFHPAALQTAIDGLKNHSERLSTGTTPYEKILIMVRDTENSILESHYAEIVRTANTQYQAWMRGILSDTYQHKQMIQKKIDELHGKS